MSDLESDAYERPRTPARLETSLDMRQAQRVLSAAERLRMLRMELDAANEAVGRAADALSAAQKDMYAAAQRVHEAEKALTNL